jgi:hypothetical protein
VKDLAGLAEFGVGVDEEDAQAVQQVADVLALVVAGWAAGEVGADGLEQHLHSAEAVEALLCGEGVGEDEREYVAADELVVVDDLVLDLIVGEDPVGEIVEYLGLIY